MPSASATGPDATSLGWRLANILAIASPYLVAAALFLVLYVSRPPASQSTDIAEPAQPAPASASGASVPVETDTTNGPGPAVESRQPAPQPVPAPRAKHATLPARAPVAAGTPAPPAHAAPGQPVHVDAAVAATMKIAGAPPAYPAIARAAGVEGTVVVALTIGPNGSVLDARALSGPPLLQPGTIFALRSWRYRPWLVYGKAVPFETEISINFQIHSVSR